MIEESILMQEFKEFIDESEETIQEEKYTYAEKTEDIIETINKLKIEIKELEEDLECCVEHHFCENPQDQEMLQFLYWNKIFGYKYLKKNYFFEISTKEFLQKISTISKLTCYCCGKKFEGKISSIKLKARKTICEECKKNKEIKQKEISENYKKSLEEQKIKVSQLKKLPYKEYLKTDHWTNLRMKILSKNHFMCSLCQSKERLNVHHKTYKRKGEEHSSDLIVLCEKCHNKFHEITKE